MRHARRKNIKHKTGKTIRWLATRGSRRSRSWKSQVTFKKDFRRFRPSSFPSSCSLARSDFNTQAFLLSGGIGFIGLPGTRRTCRGEGHTKCREYFMTDSRRVFFPRLNVVLSAINTPSWRERKDACKPARATGTAEPWPVSYLAARFPVWRNSQLRTHSDSATSKFDHDA